MRAMREFLSRRLVDSDQRHSERCRQDEVPLFVAAQADLGYNLELVIGEVVPSFSTHSQQRVLEASCISCSNNCSTTTATIANVRRFIDNLFHESSLVAPSSRAKDVGSVNARAWAIIRPIAGGVESQLAALARAISRACGNNSTFHFSSLGQPGRRVWWTHQETQMPNKA
jgi:hypothetical protein